MTLEAVRAPRRAPGFDAAPARVWADRPLRALDIVLGTLAALAVTPVIVVLSAISACSLRTWPLFVQTRPGLGTRDIRVLKIRTLDRTTPHYACKTTLIEGEMSRAMRAIRGWHLDELPQLWQVPFGRLSLVGPRPRQADHVDDLSDEFDAVRRSVRPGCTGLWQISSACTGTIADAPEYDLFWVANRSVRLALWIMWRTAIDMVSQFQPVDLRDIPQWVLPRRTFGVVRGERPIAESEAAV